jgi:hypothetical protein
MKSKSKTVNVKAWAGFYENRIATGWIKDMDYKDTMHAIFATKKEALEYCEHVLPVTITYQLPLPPKKK